MSCKISLVIFMTWWTRSRWCSWGRSTAGGTWSRARRRTSSSRVTITPTRGRRTTRGTSSWTPDKTSSSPSPSRARGARDVTRGRTGRLPGEPARGGAPYLPRRDSCGTATLLHGGGFDYFIIDNLVIFINKFMLRALLFFFEPILSHTICPRTAR